MASVYGRREDYLILPNGVRIGRLDHTFKDLVPIREAQILQSGPRSATFRVVKGVGYDEAREESRLMLEAQERRGSEIRLSVKYVDQIPRTASGKIRFVVSSLAQGNLMEPFANQGSASLRR